jgi:hypothetical protein
MRHAVARDRALERVRDVLLHRDIGEAAGAVFAGEREIHWSSKN